ncbi:MAG: DNA-3-methyladenine glycosylase 2 family protein [Betaproteobacteria bacterium]|nr:DNA-3-methyladenine glycosylase 2 family protein [Betaproteobacteria bacterium]
MNSERFKSEVQEGEAFLVRADPLLKKLIRAHGPCTMCPNWKRSPYEALVRAIMYQQLNGKAAATIMARFIGLFPGSRFPVPNLVLAKTDEQLRSAGLSRQKVTYIRDVATKALAGVIPTHRRGLMSREDEELIKTFTQAKGVGRWTVEMMLMFSLGRLDILPVDDFGVRAGYSKAKKLDAMIAPRELGLIGQRWAPYRSVAAWYMWRATEA